MVATRLRRARAGHADVLLRLAGVVIPVVRQRDDRRLCRRLDGDLGPQLYEGVAAGVDPGRGGDDEAGRRGGGRGSSCDPPRLAAVDVSNVRPVDAEDATEFTLSETGRDHSSDPVDRIER